MRKFKPFVILFFILFLSCTKKIYVDVYSSNNETTLYLKTNNRYEFRETEPYYTHSYRKRSDGLYNQYGDTIVLNSRWKHFDIEFEKTDTKKDSILLIYLNSDRNYDNLFNDYYLIFNSDTLPYTKEKRGFSFSKIDIKDSNYIRLILQKEIYSAESKNSKLITKQDLFNTQLIHHANYTKVTTFLQMDSVCFLKKGDELIYLGGKIIDQSEENPTIDKLNNYKLYDKKVPNDWLNRNTFHFGRDIPILKIDSVRYNDPNEKKTKK